MEGVRSPVLTTLLPSHVRSHSLSPLHNIDTDGSPMYPVTSSPRKQREYAQAVREAPSKANIVHIPLHRDDNEMSECEELQPSRSNGMNDNTFNNSEKTEQLKQIASYSGRISRGRIDFEDQENQDPKTIENIFCDERISVKKDILQDVSLKYSQLSTDNSIISTRHSTPTGVAMRYKKIKRYGIEDFISVKKRNIDFGIRFPGQIIEESFDISNKTSQNLLIQIEVDCFNPELQETEEYVYSLRRSYAQDYNDRHYVIIAASSTASFKVALKVPLAKSEGEIVGETRVSVQGLPGMFTTSMLTTVITPYVICPKKLYDAEAQLAVIRLAIKRGKKQETKMPIRNMSDIPVTLNFGFYTPKNMEFNRGHCLLVYPSTITLPPNGITFLNIHVKNVYHPRNSVRDESDEPECIREVLISRVVDSAVFHSFPLSIDLY